MAFVIAILTGRFRLAAMLLAAVAVSVTAAPARALDPVWNDRAVESLAHALSDAWTHGLDPADYGNLTRLRTLIPGAERDAVASDMFRAYAHDLAFGRVDPRTLDEDWTAPIIDQDIEAWLDRAAGSTRVHEALEALAPSHPDYQALRRELVYRSAVAEAPVQIAPGPAVGHGDTGARVDALRARLHQLGLLESPGRRGAVFDARLESALMRFQGRHRLAADGRLGDATRAELNASADWRAAQLKANLERWRWLTDDLGARHVRVNIADYRLESWQDGELVRAHEVMIGQQYSRTPVFSETMSYIEINPVWYAGGGLGASYMRQLRYQPATALANGYRLVDLDTGRTVDPYQADWANRRYRAIQLPGPNNAMGEVKFMFPNRHNVYIHDTPHRALFANSQRDDSAGCVRVQDPVDLAWWVLESETGWSRSRLEAVMATDDTTRVWLDHPIPVHILYFTAVADRFGAVRFVHDVYDRDAALVAALDGDYPAGPG